MGHALLLQRGRVLELVLQLSLCTTYIRYAFRICSEEPVAQTAHIRFKGC